MTDVGRVPDGTGLSQAEPVSRLGPPGFDPSRGEHPLALMVSLLGAADEVEGWGAVLEAAIMRACSAKLQQLYDALAVIEDVWTLPSIERHPSGDQWHCQHEEAMFSASRLAREAIAMEARQGGDRETGLHAKHDSAGRKASPNLSSPLDGDVVEQRGWDWLTSYTEQRHGEVPEDVAFDAQQMIDAFMEGAITATRSGDGELRWQPIETAPKDGTPILVVDDGCQQPMAVLVHWAQNDAWDKEPAWLVGHQYDWPPRYRRTPREMDIAAGTLGIMGTPTRWMPLPSPLINKG